MLLTAVVLECLNALQGDLKQAYLHACKGHVLPPELFESKAKGKGGRAQVGQRGEAHTVTWSSVAVMKAYIGGHASACVSVGQEILFD